MLVVDDEESIVQITRTILEKHGYRVVTAADGTDALAVFAMQMSEIKVVLADVMMPFMDGVALARALRHMSPHIPVIACSGQWDEAREAKLKQNGVKIFLRKPYNREKLLTALREVLDAPEARCLGFGKNERNRKNGALCPLGPFRPLGPLGPPTVPAA